MPAASNLLIGWDPVIEELVASGGSWYATLPLSYAQTERLDEKARSVTADSRLTRVYLAAAAAPTPVTVAVAAMLGASWSSTGQWRMRGFAADFRPQFEAALVAPDLAAGLSFSRGTVGRCFDAAGLNVSKANNVHRVHHDPVTRRARGLLIEPAVTNWMLHCRGTTGWTTASATLAATGTGIDGVANAAQLLTATAANGTLSRSPSAAGAVGGPYVYSVWIFGVVVTGDVRLSIDGFVTSVVVTVVVGQWRRVTLQGTYVAAAVGVRLVNSGDQVVLDFHQFESCAAATPTSEILTTTVALQRSADALQIADVTTHGVQQASMTMVVRLRLTRFATAGEDQIIGLGSTGDFIGLAIDSTGATRAVVRVGFAYQASLVGPTMAVGDHLTMAMAWAPNNVRVSFNGAAVQTDASATLPSSSQLYVNSVNGVAIELESLQLYAGVRSDAELVALAGGGEDMCLPADDDSGWVDAWPAAYLANTPERRRTLAKTPAMYRPAAAWSRAWFRLDFKDEANPAGFLEVAYLGLWWEAFQPEHNANIGRAISFKPRSSSITTDSGAKSSVVRPNPRVESFELPALSDAEAWGQVFDLLQSQGTTGMLLFSLNPTDQANLPRNTFVASIEQMPKLAAVAYRLNGAAFTVEERL